MLSPDGKKVSVTLIADSRTIVPQRGILEIDRKIERKRECKRNTRLHSLKTPRGRLELPTFRLTAERSAIELTGIKDLDICEFMVSRKTDVCQDEANEICLNWDL